MELDTSALQKIAQDYASAWSSGKPEAVASFYAADGQIQINRGDVLKGTQAIIDMAAGFFTEFPDLVLHCDEIRQAGNHALFAWTLEGHHAETNKFVKLPGWKEWDLNADGKVAASLGWFDAVEYDRQVAEGL